MNMNVSVKELRKAYATLGCSENATLTQARDAYLTWVCLLDHDTTTPAFVDFDAVPDLLHHELDLAWHAIEQAHQHGVSLLPRQPRGCQECGGTPPVRVMLHRVQPGKLRARVDSSSALMCRDCGMAAVQRAQRANLRRGWWGLLAPFTNLRAIGRNSAEMMFLRRVAPATRRDARAAQAVPQPRARWYRRNPVGDTRGFTLLAALAMVALLFGFVLPVGSGNGGVIPTSSSTGTTISATGSGASAATTSK